MVIVTVYSKKDCHLCEIAKKQLLEILKEYDFELNEIDIEEDTRIFEKFKYLIPVVEVDGKREFTYKINENELRRILMVKSRSARIAE